MSGKERQIAMTKDFFIKICTSMIIFPFHIENAKTIDLPWLKLF